MEPSPEARRWGKRQAEQSPRWSDAKWNRVADIFGVTLSAPDADSSSDEHQAAEIMRDAA
ncbi:hypothetical protein [Actinomadura rupiterrae]|uniref:hypothetical protein n=1 Tax=Actinomadura rupiterrae TaxID=559627 RepID=UPI0020A5D941|nr:hypothetical protein [Actinomadura rupiterrae]MCP2337237.1 hypothetical protein [Actinomadura rupiterrae]